MTDPLRCVKRKLLFPMIVWVFICIRRFSLSHSRLMAQFSPSGFVDHQSIIASGSSVSYSKNISIVVGLRGEMGNQISRIAFARAVQLWARDDFGIHNTELIIKAENAQGDWYKTHVEESMVTTKRCFPNMQQYDFGAGNTEEVAAAFAQQLEWLGEANASRLSLLEDSCFDENCLNDALRYLKTLLQAPPHPSNTNASISIPILLASQYSNYAFVVMDRYYQEFRNLFVFDEEVCCKLRPDPDESVFHFRNFKRELKSRSNDLGYVELSPNKTAYELFGHLRPGDKVAITTRFGGDAAQKYVSALESRGLVVRLVKGQSAVEDFCFLLSAQKELVGMAMSTFTIWAGYIGHAKRVVWYSMDTPSRRRRFGDKLFEHYNWTDPQLKQRVIFQLYKSEEAEKLDTKLRLERGSPPLIKSRTAF